MKTPVYASLILALLLGLQAAPGAQPSNDTARFTVSPRLREIAEGIATNRLILAGWQALPLNGGSNIWGPLTNSAQLSISVKPQGGDPRTNSTVVLVFRLRNISTNRTLWCYIAGAEKFSPGLTHEIVTPSTQILKLDLTIPVGQKTSGFYLSIPPGQGRQTEMEISRYVKFAEPGAYEIVSRISLCYDGAQEPFTLVSNPVLLMITR